MSRRASRVKRAGIRDVTPSLSNLVLLWLFLFTAFTRSESHSISSNRCILKSNKAIRARSVLQRRKEETFRVLHPQLPLITLLAQKRGGALQSSSLLGRIMRAWRGSAKRGGSIYGRIKRFLGFLWNAAGSSAGHDVKRSKIRSGSLGGVGGGRVGGNRMQKHLGKEFRRGNANFRVQKELREWLANPTENLQVAVGDNIRVWVVTLTGAKGTIFAGEKYKLKFTFPMDYPSKPPSVYFLQPPPRHEHVYTNGDICLNLLGRDWRPNMTASMLALSILSMLSSAREKKIPQDNHVHADNPPGKEQANWLYHDDRC